MIPAWRRDCPFRTEFTFSITSHFLKVQTEILRGQYFCPVGVRFMRQPDILSYAFLKYCERSRLQLVAGDNRKIHHGIALARDAIHAAGNSRKGCGILDTVLVAAFDWKVKHLAQHHQQHCHHN